MSKLGKKMLMFFMGILFTFICIISICYLMVSRQGRVENQKDAKATVEEALKIIDKDKVEKIIQENNQNCGEFNNVLDSMLKFKALKNVKYLYICTKADDKNAGMVVDASENPASMGKKYKLNEAMKAALNGTASVEKKPTKDEDGILLSAYAPIKDSKGKVIAFVGADKDVGQIEKVLSTLFIGLIIALAIAGVLSLIITTVFSRSLSRNVYKIQEGIKDLAEGDFTKDVSVQSKDEIEAISSALNDCRISMCEVFKLTKEMAHFVNNTSQNVAISSESINAAIEEITATINEISSSIDMQSNASVDAVKVVNSLSEDINNAANYIKNIYIISQDSKQLNNNQMKSMENLIDSYNQSKNIANTLSHQVGVLNEKAKQIGSITDIISSIAEQTNLLALNAAIEAARAGEEGKGFAVVADEVRVLAERSTVATKEINDVIKSIQENISGTVKNIELSRQFSELQSDTVNDFSKDFEKLYENINNVILKIESVENTMDVIASSKDKVTISIEDIDSMIKEDAASIRQITAAIEEQSVLTDEVASNVGNLSVSIDKLTKELDKFKIK